MKLYAISYLVGLGAAFTPFQPHQTKSFELNLTWASGAPDGVERQQALINGQYPGPPLIMDEGDDVEVVVNNFMPFNTTVHYHGIEQKGTPWSDGVPGLSQRLIPPGGSFTSNFTVQQYGTYWYHSHSAGQIMDGLYGPMYIRPRNIPDNLTEYITNDTLAQFQIQKAIENPNLVLLSDWFHMTSEELRDIATSADIDPLCGDSILINGKGRVNCRDPGYLTSMVPPSLASILQGMNFTTKGCLPLPNTYAQTTLAHNYSAVPPSLFDQCNATNATEEVIKVDPLKGWASLNFISTASLSVPTVSINNHSLWVYEVDGQFITPTKADALTIENGARYSCLVQLNKTPGDYLITVANSGFNQKVAGFGTLSYINGDPSIVSTPSINYGAVNTSADVVILDSTEIEPLFPSQPREADTTHILTSGRIERAWEWSLNGNHSYGLSLEAEKPMLWDPESVMNKNLVLSTKNNTWVDIVFAVSGNASTLQPSHPIHKHSNKVYVLGAGSGMFNWASVAEAVKDVPEMFNLVNPPIRDTFTTLPAFQGPSWMAVRYHVQNPGAFLLHCHIDPHLTGGMGLAILDGVDAWPSIPAQYGPEGHWNRV
ncbi:hypothetical protein ASPWEDRAFT_120138 [Aspergillus wentii DTO 134E9]|uniref:Multicopper oxidase n=1 Tax=Aspergillus wentii DTO 134E9 TaxID=1073089 RepID=A0A1L9R7I0_ASPWE|nr:uncharacterized protein ASPWEDRAFT_120138 [Aspergillus wentii DTO 134E9]OJJ30871.1 hypothetical protein ASPWEDRAFT_120138 [Aspergillus wentii DTO 134E9]